MGCALLSSPKMFEMFENSDPQKSERLWEYMYAYGSYVQMR
jgi:hypothetical protein